MVGSVVTFPWPVTNSPTFGITTTEPDEEGTIGVMVLNPHVHVNLEDVEEI